MNKLVTVSNRLPMSVAKRESGLVFESSAGGLATGLRSFFQSRPSAWVGWPGIASGRLDTHEEKLIVDRLAEERCRPVFLTAHEIEQFYHGFSNRTLWPLFHYFPLYAAYNKNAWQVYKRVNEKFRDEVLRAAGEDDDIWIHDYHLLLLPAMLRERLPNASIGFFLHIPFPSYEIFRLLPWREEILRGMLGADLAGFHTYGYAHHFLDSVRHLLEYETVQWEIRADHRLTRVDAFPMGIDYERFHSAAAAPEIARQIETIRKRASGKKIILSVDRLDYTKGIPQRLEAFELFLERNPAFREKVTFILIAVPSRTSVDAYSRLKNSVDELVGRINGRFGTLDWVPIWYLYRMLPFKQLVPYYSAADVALITPLRDGMNLIAKEYVAAKTDRLGVLILSEMAGSAKELGDAIHINPNNREEVAAAILTALTLSEDDQRARLGNMQERLRRFTVTRWADDFFAELRKVKDIQRGRAARRLDPGAADRLVEDYRRARRRLLFLDYDGTLIPFAPTPEQARPDPELIRLLTDLARPPENELVIISGRVPRFLEDWLGGTGAALVAEHGAWVQAPGGAWSTLEALRTDWKPAVKEVLQQYGDRMPGSLIEEKNYSLAFHYRRVHPEIAVSRLIEMKEDLIHITAPSNLNILEGEKVIEVRNAEINKGRAAFQWISGLDWDFIFAAGDDRTDEDLFAVMPPEAYSIKVGLDPSGARFNLENPAAVRRLLQELVKAG